MNRSRQVNVRLTPDEYQYVQQQASKRRITVAVYFREAMLTHGLLREGAIEELPGTVKQALEAWHLEQHLGD